MKAYLFLVKCISTLENLFCFSMLILCSFLVLLQVLNRYIFHFEIMWIGDLSLYLFIPSLIYSIAITTREQHHTSVDVFMEMSLKNKPEFIKLSKIFINILVLSVIIYLIPMAHRQFMSAIKYPEYGTLVPWFNTSWIRQSVLIALSLCAFHTLHHILMQTLDFIKGFNSGGLKCP
ncbi:TRAP transporter small permease [Marinobacterium iners]|uniref:TRAP transporter small permease protein n=1 Tax=Marinobacterium iners DSM 11526 TaxID=1122198 RepID=A0A1H3X4L0_9GAMM|nr:TRAP-type C4-dicarboxylate transport system, small permease component [Marinobacterium iners DSM 11526]